MENLLLIAIIFMFIIGKYVKQLVCYRILSAFMHNSFQLVYTLDWKIKPKHKIYHRIANALQVYLQQRYPNLFNPLYSYFFKAKMA